MKIQLGICLCVILIISMSQADLVNLDKVTKDKKSDTEQDESSEIETEMDSEYLHDLRAVVQNQLQELKHYMSSIKDEHKLKLKIDESKDSKIEEGEDTSEKAVSHKFISDIKPGWFDTIAELTHNNMEGLEENPQEMLDQLPPLPEEEEQPLTPELEEGERMYDDAIRRLNRRSADPAELSRAVELLRAATERGHLAAELRLAWALLFGEEGDLLIDEARAVFEKYSDQGNPDAQAGMAFLYASGLGVEVSQARALVLYTLAALGNNTEAQMALAYRYWSGATVAPDCEKALYLYRKVASKVASQVTFSGGPAIQRVHLLEEQDNSGLAAGVLDNDLIDYYQLLAEKGDVQAQVGLGQLHLQGGRGVTLDIHKALHYFTAAAKAGNAIAMAFLGKIYLEGGDGIKADNETALRYFKKAAELNNPVGQSGLGLMYLQGRGVERDTRAALKYFTLAANQGWVDGQLHLANMYFAGTGVRRDLKLANKYYSLASQSGHVLAFYHLGQMHAQGLGVIRSCTTAVELFKNVCERGTWGARLMAAHGTWRAGRRDAAFVQYAAMAERGYEVAQSNAAALLDAGEVTLFLASEVHVRALAYWTRAASQGYSPARVKLGDYHYYGLGTEVDYEAAASHYRIASEQQRNAQATFNLGYMHERGLGLARDVHLAKRCYDLAADTAPEARLPVALALLKLNLLLGIDSIKDGPLSVLWMSGEAEATSNWDVYLITALLGALGLVLYIRRPAPRQPQPR